MMASSRAFASDAGGESASPPANAGGSAPAINLGSSVGVAYENGTEVTADVAVDTQIQQWGASMSFFFFLLLRAGPEGCADV